MSGSDRPPGESPLRFSVGSAPGDPGPLPVVQVSSGLIKHGKGTSRPAWSRHDLDRQITRLLIETLAEPQTLQKWATAADALSALPLGYSDLMPSPGIAHYIERAAAAAPPPPARAALRQAFPRAPVWASQTSEKGSDLVPPLNLSGSLVTRPELHRPSRAVSARGPRPRTAGKLVKPGASTVRAPARPPPGLSPRRSARPDRPLYAFSIDQVFEYDVPNMPEAASIRSSMSPRFRAVNAPPRKAGMVTRIVHGKPDLSAPDLAAPITAEWSDSPHLTNRAARAASVGAAKAMSRTGPPPDHPPPSAGLLGRPRTVSTPGPGSARPAFHTASADSTNARSHPSLLPSVQAALDATPEATTRSLASSRRPSGPGPAAGLLTSPESGQDFLIGKRAEEAVSFFASTDSTDQVKFLYLNPVARPDSYRPYDLVVVRRDETEPEHFTMSAAGLVHIRPGEPTEYHSLAEWMNHSTLFNLLRSMKFFKYYSVGKAFRFWRSYVRHKRYCQTRKHLASRMFLAKPVFSSALLSVNKTIVELQNIKFLSADTQNTYTREEFLDVQAQLRKSATKAIDALSERVQVVLKRLCQDVIDRTQRPDEISAILAEDEALLLENIEFGTKRKTKSMVGEKQERVLRERELRIACEEARLLGSFIQLVDHIAVENLTAVAVSNCVSLVGLIKSTWKLGMFSTTVSIGESEIVLDPDREDFLAALSNTIEETITSVHGIMRPLYVRSLKPYVAPPGGPVPRGPSVLTIIRDSPPFIAMRSELERLINDDFDEVVNFAESFEEYRAIQDFAASWSIEAYKATSRTVEEFSADLARMDTWIASIERIKNSTALGLVSESHKLFSVDSKKLKASLKPIPTQASDQIKEHLHSVALAQTEAVRSQFQSHSKALRAKPTRLREFTAYVAIVNSLRADSQSLFDAAAAVERMVGLLRSSGVEISHTDKAATDLLGTDREDFQEELKEGYAYVTESLPAMAADLESTIQVLDESLNAIQTDLQTGPYVDPSESPETVLAALAATKESIGAAVASADTYKAWIRTFLDYVASAGASGNSALSREGEADSDLAPLVPPTLELYRFSGVEKSQKLYENRLQIWTNVAQWQSSLASWKTVPFTSLSMEAVEKQILELVASTKRAAGLSKDSSTEDLVAAALLKALQDFSTYIPILMDLGIPAMQPRHWKSVFHELRLPYSQNAHWSLADLQRPEIFEHSDRLAEISATAAGEWSLDKTLTRIASVWESYEFKTIPHRDSKDVMILGGLEDLTQLLEDHQILVSTMRSSRYAAGVSAEISLWESRLNTLSEILEEWLQTQKYWLYLEVVFGQADIQRQLPTEAAMFRRVDGIWREFMRKIHYNPAVQDAMDSTELIEMFQDANEKLEKIQKSLEDYLTTKRKAFPRFNFLSNDELLDILAQSRNPRAVQPHLRKCFDAIAELEFSNDAKTQVISAMVSAEGEAVPLRAPVFARGNVEYWLTDVERVMQVTLYDIMKECLLAYTAMDSRHWLFRFPAQAVLTVVQIVWTNEVTKGLDAIAAGLPPKKLIAYRAMFSKQLESLVSLVRGDLDGLQRTLVTALIVIAVHGRDVLDSLVSASVSGPADFSWSRQLRYYWDAELDNCVVSQSHSSFLYGYEYLGNTPRLVITPLTDRCYLTLTSALHVHLGGAPTGPAGTGKTETIKDLAKALARQCVVFNCSDGLDYKIMGQFFAGLAQAGAWACFDEFNRIDIEVLSVIAQQVLTIQQGLMGRKETIMFEGRQIPLNPNYGAFITMNPGYAGRTELPENLKVLFRPVGLMVPDYAQIAEIILYSEGFQSAKPLAAKMVALYRLCAEQLSHQDHYDFGMRALKSVLVTAGAVKRASADLAEDLVLVRALRDSSLPKFTAADVPLFLAIIQDLFPGVEIPPSADPVLTDAITRVLQSRGLVVVPAFVDKVIQLYETLLVRHGAMLVGPTGAGKTTAYSVLGEALGLLKDEMVVDVNYEHVQSHVINPKAVTVGDLYGAFNELTHEWRDGIVPSILRSIGANKRLAKQWIVFDGPVDAGWVENMNTVLDDNKLLFLANGERIKLPDTARMLFEVADLAAASPATVSRCGMVFMEPASLGWRPMAASWAAGLSLEPEAQSWLESVTKKILDPLLDVIEETIGAVDLDRLGLVGSFHRLAGAMLKPGTLTGRSLEAAVVFSLVWGLGGSLPADARPVFCATLIELLSPFKVSLPVSPDLFEWFAEADGSWVPWSDMKPPYRFDAGASSGGFVPTVESVRISRLMDILVRGGIPVLLSGPPGVGKSVIAGHYLKQLASAPEGDEGVQATTWAWTQSNLTATSVAADMEELIEAGSERIRKGVIGAAVGCRRVFFLDDLAMPARDEHGTASALEFLRQLLQSRGFFNRTKLSWIGTENLQFVGAVQDARALHPRLGRHFNVLHIPDRSAAELSQVFVPILDGFLGTWPGAPALQSLAEATVKASIAVYRAVATELRPTPSKSHYSFNQRDLSALISGLLRADPESVTNRSAWVRLWAAEAAFVFRNRLTTEADRLWVNELLSTVALEAFETQLPVADIGELMFSPVRSSEPGKVGHVYAEVTDKESLRGLFSGLIESYNAAHPASRLDLVLFDSALAHLNRLTRVLSQPGGHALLVGVDGTGRRSIARMAAFTAGARLCQLSVGSDYGLAEFREELKEIVEAAGVAGTKSVLLVSDADIVDESILQDIHSLLSAGSVPGLFSRDEVDVLTSRVAAEFGLASVSAAWSAFVDRVKANLSVVLAMSPAGPQLRSRIRDVPALVNSCAIDWYDLWSAQALSAVASRALADLDLGQVGSEGRQVAVRAGLAQVLVSMHGSAAAASESLAKSPNGIRTYVTPATYLSLLDLFRSLLGRQRLEFDTKLKRYQDGLSRLADTANRVGEMQAELGAMQPVLTEAARHAQELLGRISADQTEVDSMRQTVVAERALVAKKAEETQKIHDEATMDLEEAMPAYHKAVKALKALSKKDIDEVRHFTSPPARVVTVMEAVCLLLGAKQTWDDAKRLLSSSGFLKSLESYDKDNISPSVLARLKRYVNDPEFQPATVGKSSSAAKSLCMWVRAIDTYARVYKGVVPKKKKLAAAQERLDAANAELAEKKAALQDVEARMEELQSQYSSSLEQQRGVEDKIKLTQTKIERATKLISGLAAERERWTEAESRLLLTKPNILGNTLLAAGMISYLGPLPVEARRALAASWKSAAEEADIAVSPGVSLTSVLTNSQQIRSWVALGLPSDSLSTENAVITKRGARWPLVVDPQGQARAWIKAAEAEGGLKVLSLSDSGYLRHLEAAVRVGTPVLLENVGTKLDPVLRPLLEAASADGARRPQALRLGDVDLELHPAFRLYLRTSDPFPAFLPDVSSRVSVVNFAVAQEGLTEQLLSVVVRVERPDLEVQRDSLVVEMAANAKELAEIEDGILGMIADASGNILDDEALIRSLDASKTKSEELKAETQQATETAAEIDKIRGQYRPVAVRGALLYYAMADLGRVDSMYQFSLFYFKRLFESTLRRGAALASASESKVSARNAGHVKAITDTVYTSVCRGLFSKDKLLFAFMVASRVGLADGSITRAEWDAFLHPAVPQLTASPGEEGLERPDWVSAGAWAGLGGLPDGPALQAALAGDKGSAWHDWLGGAAPPWDAGVPGGLGLSPFGIVSAMSLLRPERLVGAMRWFVGQVLGAAFMKPPPFDLQKAFRESEPSTPIIFIISGGADPTAYLMDFAKSQGWDKRTKMVSLGQGQGPIASAAISRAVVSGDWVVLQNCHLAVSWLPALRSIVDGLAAREVHADFRLWLTSAPTPAFPAAILQSGLKLTKEPPKGLKSNMEQSYLDLNEATFEACSMGPEWKALLFGLSFFHAAIQERRKYGPIGFNVPYQWNNADWMVSVQMLQMYLNELPAGAPIPFDALRVMIGEIHYGGRVTDSWDQRTVEAMLAAFFNPAILDGGAALTADGSYVAPPTGDLTSFRKFVSSLSADESPLTLGLHANADNSFQRAESGRLLGVLRGLAPRLAETAAGSSESGMLAMIRRLVDAIPAELRLENAAESVFAESRTGALNALGTFAVQEVDRFNSLLAVLRDSLNSLERSLQGLELMSPQLEALYSALQAGLVPSEWTAAGYPSDLGLSPWMTELAKRVAELRSWLVNGPPDSFWLPGMFFPQGFITSVLQGHARETGTPIDELVLEPIVLDEAPDGPPPSGAYVHGVHLEGASWADGGLCEQEVDCLSVGLPTIWLKVSSSRNPAGAGYVCPVYSTPSRAGDLSTTGVSSNFVFEIELPTGTGDANHWVKRGVALLLQPPAEL